MPRIVPTAFFRYSTDMPLGIQRMSAGMVASVITPAPSSARLHSAIACTVPMWLCTRRRSRMRTSQRPGSSATKRGAIVAKYGALRQTSREKIKWPVGQRVMRRYSDNTEALIDCPPGKEPARKAGRPVGSVYAASARVLNARSSSLSKSSTEMNSKTPSRTRRSRSASASEITPACCASAS